MCHTHTQSQTQTHAHTGTHTHTHSSECWRARPAPALAAPPHTLGRAQLELCREAAVALSPTACDQRRDFLCGLESKLSLCTSVSDSKIASRCQPRLPALCHMLVGGEEGGGWHLCSKPNVRFALKQKLLLYLKCSKSSSQSLPLLAHCPQACSRQGKAGQGWAGLQQSRK